MKRLSSAPALLTLIICCSFFLHYRIFNLDILGPHTWRQTYTQSNIDCFYEEDNNILHPRLLARGETDGISPKEFPLFQWTTAQVYRMFHQSIAVTRYYCFALSSLGIIAFYLLVTLMTRNKMLGVAGASMFMFSPLFYYYSVNPLPDIFALSTAIWSMYFFYRHAQSGQAKHSVAAALFLCAAAMTKLPYILFAGIPAGMLFNMIRSKETGSKILSYSLHLVFLIPVIWWYSQSLQEMKDNPVLGGFLSNFENESSVGEIIVGQLISMLPELYLNYTAVLFFLAGFIFVFRKRASLLNKHLPLLLTALLLFAYFGYEITLIGLIHDYYMLPFLPLLFLIAVAGIQFLISQNRQWISYVIVVLIMIGPATAWLRIDSRWSPNKSTFNNDWYTYRNEIRNAAPDSVRVIIGNDETQSILPYYAHKRCWTYVDYELSPVRIEKMISQGARFLFTDSEYTLNDSSMQRYLTNKKAQFGSVYVYELHPAQ